jgi:hypothetical protein
VAATSSESVADLEALASTYKVDLTQPPASDFVLGEDGLKQRLADLDAKRREIVVKADADVATAAAQVQSSLEAWRGRQVKLEERLAIRKTELEQQGLKVQADAIVAIANRLNTVKTQLVTLRKKAQDHETAIKTRAELLVALEANRERLYRTREATLKRIAEQANTWSCR